nr:hypothetical protein Iba_chr12cCG10250 [Ipomoea batatas]GMD94828.1 hypothetical protein Iba_chr15aCG6340 [Ipomoea batatas]GMD98618.1 hypothetical protein Iba_chr15dCG4500 [Ipomoea batatas]
MVGRGIFPFQIPQASYHSYQGQKQRKGSLLQITHCWSPLMDHLTT